MKAVRSEVQGHDATKSVYLTLSRFNKLFAEESTRTHTMAFLTEDHPHDRGLPQSVSSQANAPKWHLLKL